MLSEYKYFVFLNTPLQILFTKIYHKKYVTKTSPGATTNTFEPLCIFTLQRERNTNSGSTITHNLPLKTAYTTCHKTMHIEKCNYIVVKWKRVRGLYCVPTLPKGHNFGKICITYKCLNIIPLSCCQEKSAIIPM